MNRGYLAASAHVSRIDVPKLYRDIGMAAPELEWVPTPTYLLRRAAIFDIIGAWPAGRALEVGCGSGALLFDLARLGYTGLGVELSARAREVAAQILVDEEQIRVVPEVPSGPKESFDLLIAFEVLEHIEDDRAALASWLTLLRPGGRVVISVPAHRRRWSATDVLVGHYRRYDRQDVEALLRDAGLVIDDIRTFGWPATWLIERARNLAKPAQARAEDVDIDALEIGDRERTLGSGIERSLERRLFPVYASPLGRLALRGAATIQRRFYRTDLGISYLAVATKPAGS